MINHTIRRFYVHPDHRRSGIGHTLVSAIIEQTKPYFLHLVLHTDTARDHAFYGAIGFSPATEYLNATHCLTFEA
ncbi:GNAT family N-acetyltransferase [Exiguobacterium algae]|uniref:GNAT family N-acetyltransferase n=1 Tax=Exiguobacterium algae TaxID=2751250 RepID=UPI001BEA3AB2|nr:GNAT family N-acetyltransferase [Exiguobacterium algae]